MHRFKLTNPDLAARVVFDHLPSTCSDSCWARRKVDSSPACSGTSGTSFSAALGNPVVWLLGATLFLPTTVSYAQILWLPQILKGLRLSDMRVGLVVSGIGILSTVVLYANGVHSDRRGERYVHAAIPVLLTCVGWLMLGRVQGLIFGTLVLAVLACRKSMDPPFWALSRSFLTGAAAAGGFALINSMATFGGFVGPTLLGLLLKSTGGYRAAFAVLAVLGASVAVLIFGHATRVDIPGLRRSLCRLQDEACGTEINDWTLGCHEQFDYCSDYPRVANILRFPQPTPTAVWVFSLVGVSARFL